MEAELVPFDESIPDWEKAFYAFLAEKERCSGSKRTVEAYSRTLQRFSGTLGKTPEQITERDVFSFAHGIGPSGKKLVPVKSAPHESFFPPPSGEPKNVTHILRTHPWFPF